MHFTSPDPYPIPIFMYLHEMPRPVHAPTGDLELEERLLFHSCVEMYRKLPKHFLIEYIRNLKTYVQKLAHEPGGFALSTGCSCSGTGTAN